LAENPIANHQTNIGKRIKPTREPEPVEHSETRRAVPDKIPDMII